MSLTKASYSMITGAPVNVKDFGATGDGTTDDTAAIQAAITYCTNLSNRRQTLYFPANNATQYYKTTAPLVVNGRLNIVGDGEFTTTIFAVGLTAGQFILDFDNLAADNVEFGGVSKITLRSNVALPTAIRLKNASYWTFKNVQLSTLTTGIYVTGTRCFSNFFEQVTGNAISSYTVQMDSFTGGGQFVFNGCTFTGSDGFYITSTATTDGLSFFGCNFEQCVVTDILVLGTIGGLTISGCRSEGLDGATSFKLNPSGANYINGVSITGCVWSTDFGNGYAVDLSGTVKGFSITGNYAAYIGLLGFVRLNGGGEAGVISGNYCENSPVDKIVSVPRAGVLSFSNYNSSGAMTDYNGLIVEGRAAAAPVTGTYAVGSIIYNTAPASAGFVGFVCTVAGTPGTWKTFGLIS
jgi:hypothetical protein